MADGTDGAPIPFISVEGGKFVVNEDVVEMLQGVGSPIAIISVVGLYRTGKSFLLNKLIGAKQGPERKSAFAVGPTVAPCTKGIWLWGKPIDVNGTTVFFMDTEGTDSTEKDSTYDSRVFSLAVLLSSLLIYNSVGSIDENSLNKLSLVTSLTKHIHIKQSIEGDEDDGSLFAEYFPQFLWVIRDFSLQLEDHGRKFSSKTYLEEALQPKPGFSQAVMDKNRIRKMISSFFQDRNCVTLVRPLIEEERLQDIMSVPEEELRPEFMTQFRALKEEMMGSLKPKTVDGKLCNGAVLAGLAKCYVDAINTGHVPTILNAWDNVVEIENRKAMDGSVSAYRKSVSDAKHGTAMPVDACVLMQWHTAAVEQAVGIFEKAAIGDDRAEHKAQLMKLLEEENHKTVEANANASAELCDKLLSDLFAPIARTVSEEGYHNVEELLGACSAMESSYLGDAKGPAVMKKLVSHLQGAKIHALEKVASTLTARQKEADNKAAAATKDLEQRLEKAELERERQVDLLNQQLEAKGKALGEAQGREAALRDEFTAFKAKAQADLAAANESHATERKELKDEVSHLRSHEEELEGKLAKTEQSLVSAEAETKRVEAMAAQQKEFATRQHEEGVAREEELKKSLDDAKAKAKDEIFELKGRIDKLREEGEVKTRELSKRATDAEGSLAEVKAALEQERTVNTTKATFLQQSVDEAKEREAKVKAKMEKKQAKAEDALTELRTTMTEKCDKLSAELSETKSKLRDAEHSAEETSRRLTLEESIWSDKVDALTRRLEKEEERGKEAAADWKSNRKELKQTISELKSEHRDEVDELKQQCAVLTTSKEELSKEVKHLHTKLEEMQANFSKKEEELEAQVDTCKGELEGRVAALQAQVDKMHDDCKDKESQCCQVEAALEAETAAKLAAESQIEQLTSASASLVDELAELRLSHEQLIADRDEAAATATASGGGHGGDRLTGMLGRLMHRDTAALEKAEEQRKRLVSLSNQLTASLSEKTARVTTLEADKRTTAKKLDEYWRRIQDLERERFRAENKDGTPRSMAERVPSGGAPRTPKKKVEEKKSSNDESDAADAAEGGAGGKGAADKEKAKPPPNKPKKSPSPPPTTKDGKGQSSKGDSDE